MPVRVAGTTPASDSTIAADGAVPTQFESTASTATIVPLLIFGTDVNELSVDNVSITPPPALRPLASHQQLVAVAGGGDRLAAKMFPGESIVTIHVDPLDPLPGPPLAWQTLDALIVDGPWPGSFDVHKLPALLAGGTEVAVHSQDRPADLLPWESIDGGWVLRPLIAGPMGCDGNEQAYVPTLGWHPDLPGPVRVRVILAGVLFSLAVLACLLLPSRFMLTGIMLATVLALITIGAWQENSAVICCARGSIALDAKALLQSDRWQFIAARQSTGATCDCIGETWPVFADPSQAKSVNVALHWNGDAGRFSFDLPANGKLAFVSRMLQPQSAASTAGTAIQPDSPMADLARALYLHGREQITQEPAPPWNADDTAPVWPAVQIAPNY